MRGLGVTTTSTEELLRQCQTSRDFFQASADKCTSQTGPMNLVWGALAGLAVGYFMWGRK